MPLGTNADHAIAHAHAFLVIDALIERINELDSRIIWEIGEDLRRIRDRLEFTRKRHRLEGADHAVLHQLAYVPCGDWANLPIRREIAHLAQGLATHVAAYQLCHPRPRTA